MIKQLSFKEDDYLYRIGGIKTRRKLEDQQHYSSKIPHRVQILGFLNCLTSDRFSLKCTLIISKCTFVRKRQNENDKCD